MALANAALPDRAAALSPIAAAGGRITGMSVLFENILRGHVTGHRATQEAWDISGVNLGRMITRAVLVDVAAVADYLRTLGDARGRFDLAAAVPNGAPAWRDAFYSYRSPLDDGTLARVGVFVHASPEDYGGWTLTGFPVVDSLSRRTKLLPVFSVARLNGDGSVRGNISLRFSRTLDAEVGASLRAGYVSLAQHACAVALLANCFVHCRNVVVREGVAERGARRRAEKAGAPTYRHYTLDIPGITRILDSEGGARAHGLARALHICRGHFKHFRSYFGGAPRTVWTPMHLRGDPERGIVDKDYRASPP